MSEWFENDHFWETMYPILFTEYKFDAAADDIAKLLTLIPYDVNNVLDLCCGPGRHSVELAKLNIEVTGVDRTAYLLKIAQEYAQKENLDIEWVQEDMRVFRRSEEYDLVVNLYTSFGYCDQHSDNRQVLSMMYENLAIDGVAVIQVIGKEILARDFQPTMSMELTGGAFAVQRLEILDDWSRVYNDWTIVKNDTAETFSFEQWIYSGWELKTMLLDAGFKSVHLFGALDGRPYDEDAEWLVAVAYK